MFTFFDVSCSIGVILNFNMYRTLYAALYVCTFHLHLFNICSCKFYYFFFVRFLSNLIVLFYKDLIVKMNNLVSMRSVRRILTHFSTNIRAFSAVSNVEEEIVVPKRIHRSPTDILNALSATVGRDPTAAHYKYHDDPFLIPASNIGKRSFAMAQESGRKAARWIRQTDRQWFNVSVIFLFFE